MDFDLTEEQTLLRDAALRLLRERYGFEARRGYMASPEGFSRDLWAAYAEMGLLGLPFATAVDVYDGVDRDCEADIWAFHKATSPSACRPWPGHKEASGPLPRARAAFSGGPKSEYGSRQRISGEPRPGGPRKRKQRLAVPQRRG